MAELLNKKKYEVEFDNLIDPGKFPTVYRTIPVSSVTAAKGAALTYKSGAYKAAATGDSIVAIAAADIASDDTAADVLVAGAFVASSVKVGTAAPTEADKVSAQGNGLYLI